MNDQPNQLGLSSWTFERPFRFESSGTLQEVLHSLAALEEQGGFFSSSRNEMSILPLNDGYTFRYRIRRRNRSRNYTTAYGEGQIWEMPDGGIVVEGSAHIEPWGLYGSMTILSVAFIFFGIVSRGFSILPFFMIAMGAYLIFTYYQDHNRVIERISAAVDYTINGSEQFRRLKDKRAPTSEKVKNTHLSLDEASRPNSVWSEAISEYEDDEQRDLR